MRIPVNEPASVAGERPILVLPGLGLSSRYLQPARELLGGWTLDPLGFGASPRPRHVLDIGEHAAVVERWLEARTLEQVVVFGNSFGSQLAVELALRAPARVRGVVLGAPTPVAEHRSYLMHVARLLEAGWRAPRELRRLALRDYRSALRRIAVTGHYAIRDPIRAKLARVRVPALVLHGRDDPVARGRWAHEVANLLAFGSLVELSGAAHAAVFTEPHEVAEVVGGFARLIEPS